MSGLRERKKAESRERISSAARRLFFEHGYDSVTVAAVADAADVSPATVFNYFRSKEELFFSGLDAFEQHLVESVRDRPAGQSVLAAFRQAVLTSTDNLAGRGAARGVARAAGVIRGNQALQNEERAVRARHARSLAMLAAEESGTADPTVEAVAVSAALMAIHAAVVDLARDLAARGIVGKQLAEAVRAQATVAFDRLAGGLADYGVR